MNFPMVFRIKDYGAGHRFIILLGPLNDDEDDGRPTSPGISISEWQSDEIVEYKDDFFADLDQFGWEKLL